MKHRMPFAEAWGRADSIRDLLWPHCVRCEIGGSIRRRLPRIGDIEIVCIPERELMEDLLGEIASRYHRVFVHAVESLGTKVRGSAEGRYAARRLADGVQVDIFMADEDNWGLIWLIRTGSVAWVKGVMVALRQRGYRSAEGRLVRVSDGSVVPTRDEWDVLSRAGMGWVEPELREGKQS